MVESQGEVLKSEECRLRRHKKLDLNHNDTFTTSSGVFGLVSRALAMVLPSHALNEFEVQRQTMEQFQDRLTIKRSGVSYICYISFLSPDPQQAADIANAVADAYVSDDLEAKSSALHRATVWMQDGLKQLSEEATTLSI